MAVGLQIRQPLTAHPLTAHRPPLIRSPLIAHRCLNIEKSLHYHLWCHGCRSSFLIPQFKILPIISTPILLKKKF